MGRIVLVCRLAARDLRRHPAQALLLLLVITAAMATLTLGLILYGVTRQPYEQTRAATAGPDVVAATAGVQWIYSSGSAGQSTEISASDFSRLAALPHAPGITAEAWRRGATRRGPRLTSRRSFRAPGCAAAGWSWSGPSLTRLVCTSATTSPWTAGGSGWRGSVSR